VVGIEVLQPGLSLYTAVVPVDPMLLAKETKLYIPTSSVFFARNHFFPS
jgi:hypothetical protein